MLLFGRQFVLCTVTEPVTRFPLHVVCLLGSADRKRMMKMKALFRPHNLLH